MTDEEKDIVTMRQHLRNTFDSPSGKVVWHSLMAKSGFFDNIKSDDAEMIGRSNMMKEYIRLIAYTADPAEISEAFLQALLKQPVITEEVKE